MINAIKQTIKENLEAYYNEKYNVEINFVVEEPKKPEMGDLSVPGFSVCKALKKALPECVEEIKEVLSKIDIIKEINVLGGFINLRIDKTKLSYDILVEALNKKENYASDTIGLGKNIVLDYSSPNIAKPFSVGHLRSTIIGNSLKLIYKKLGYNTIGINHLGDWGTQFGKVIVAYKKWGSEEAVKKNSLKELSRIYVKFHEEAKKDQSLDDEARRVFMELENGNEEYMKLWQWFRDESVKEAMFMYDLLDVSFDSYNGEAFFNDKMDPIVSELEEKNLLKEDNGAMIVDLGEQMPPALIKKTGGASLYITRDLAALFYRKKEYNFEKVIYVVGNEQKLHFNQLKAVVDKMGYDFSKDIYHVNFGLVLQNGKKMSTRDGKVVTLYEVLQSAIKVAYDQINEKNQDLEDKEEIAKKIGIGAIVFNDLKNHRTLDVEFDLAHMTKFEGQTGPYLQYTVVRIKSILRENKLDLSNITLDVFEKEHYYDIVKTVSQFNQHIRRAAVENAPSVIAKYLLGLAQAFNKFYGLEKIVNEDLTKRNSNLLLLNAVLVVLEEGLRLLGVKTLERM